MSSRCLTHSLRMSRATLGLLLLFKDRDWSQGKEPASGSRPRAAAMALCRRSLSAHTEEGGTARRACGATRKAFEAFSPQAGFFGPALPILLGALGAIMGGALFVLTAGPHLLTVPPGILKPAVRRPLYPSGSPKTARLTIGPRPDTRR
jgi:hypothetical protein